MTRHFPILILGMLLTASWLVSDVPITAQEPPAAPAPDNSFEVLGRGPVHEAFAEPVAGAKAAPIVAKEPPAPIQELPPDQKPEGQDVQWISGYWAWDEDSSSYLWVSGVWRDIPPGRQWVPGYWTQLADGWQRVSGFWVVRQQGDLQFLPPPPASLDNGPSAPAPLPAEDYTWTPGNWVYQPTGYAWRPGFWLRYQPNWVWTPARYVWTPAGFLYTDGYWDYPLRYRGLLFAPIRLGQPLVWGSRGWYYRPSYWISDNALFGAMFVRPGYPGYYFGDYFGAPYARAGFTPWYDYRYNRHAYDPLFGYYRWNHRGTPWERDLNTLYVRRRNGEAPLPPHTLTAQNTARTQPAGKTAHDPQFLTSLAQTDRNVIKLNSVSSVQLADIHKATQQLSALGQQRAKAEKQVAAKGVPQKAGDTPHVTKLDLPHTGLGKETGKAPVGPLVPKVDLGKTVIKPEVKPLDPKTNPSVKTPELKPLDPKPKTPELKPLDPKPKTPELKPLDPKPKTPEVKPLDPKPKTPEVKPLDLKPKTPEIKPADPKPNPPVKAPELKPNPPVKTPDPKPNPPPANKDSKDKK